MRRNLIAVMVFAGVRDSREIAYWQIDDRQVNDYIMINTTDSIYPKIIPVSYSIAGEKPALYKIGVVDINTAQTKWMDIPQDTSLGNYVTTHGMGTLRVTG